MLVDKAHLVNINQLQTSSPTVTDNQINQSITAQLSNASLNGSDNNDSSDISSQSTPSMPPIYYVRPNPYSAKHVDINWGNNEVVLVDNLFVKDNLAKIDKQIKAEQAQIKVAQNTMKEYDERLKISTNDANALSDKSDLQSNINSLQDNLMKNEQEYQRLKDARLSKHILGPEQTKNYIIKTNKLNVLQGGTNNGSGN